MSETPSQDQIQEMLKWFNHNKRKLIQLYPDRYIAYNANGVIGDSENLQEILKLAEASEEVYSIYLVPKIIGSIVINPISFRSVTRQNWQPNYQIELKHKNYQLSTTILVDSGAEISLISLKIGQDLGFALADAESTLLAETIGGNVEYVLRNLEMVIDKHHFIAPIAWLQTKTKGEQLLLGREVVFDRFDIEFKQAEEKIIFTWREEL